MHLLIKSFIMRKILFYLLPFMLVCTSFTDNSQFMVSGFVFDDQGNPLNNVSVNEKGFNTGTLSGKDGSYKISVAGKNATLIFSASGYITKEEKVNGRSTVSVKLLPSMSLQEVTVVGYGKAKNRVLMHDQSSNTKSIPGMSPGFFQERNPVDYNTEDYDNITDNRFLRTAENPLSTFSIDVDAASYSNIRRYVNRGERPPAGAVRIEEMINYFKYDYPQPKGEDPFSFYTEMSD